MPEPDDAAQQLTVPPDGIDLEDGPSIIPSDIDELSSISDAEPASVIDEGGMSSQDDVASTERGVEPPEDEGFPAEDESLDSTMSRDDPGAEEGLEAGLPGGHRRGRRR